MHACREFLDDIIYHLLAFVYCTQTYAEENFGRERRDFPQSRFLFLVWLSLYLAGPRGMQTLALFFYFGIFWGNGTWISWILTKGVFYSETLR